MAAPESAQILRAEPRRPLAAAVVVPTGQRGRISKTWLLSELDRRLDLHTAFRLQSVDEQAVADCGGSMQCIVRAVRPDYRREALLSPDGSPRPFEEHLRALDRDDRVVPELLLLVLNLTQEGSPDLISVQLVHTDSALSVYHGAPRTADDGWQRDVDARIKRIAVIAQSERVEIAGEDAALRFLDAFFGGEFKEAIDTRDWSPYGALELAPIAQRATVKLNGRAVGATVPHQLTRIEQLRRGQHEVELILDGERRYRGSLEIATPNQTVRLDPELTMSSEQPLVRRAHTWASVAVAAVGIGVGLYSLTLTDGRLSYCYGTSDPDVCGRDRRFVERAGVLLFPLGLSLAVAGGSTGLLVELGPGTGWPWWETLVGVALGGVAYGVAAAAGG